MSRLVQDASQYANGAVNQEGPEWREQFMTVCFGGGGGPRQGDGNAVCDVRC